MIHIVHINIYAVMHTHTCPILIDKSKEILHHGWHDRIRSWILNLKPLITRVFKETFSLFFFFSFKKNNKWIYRIIKRSSSFSSPQKKRRKKDNTLRVFEEALIRETLSLHYCYVVVINNSANLSNVYDVPNYLSWASWLNKLT